MAALVEELHERGNAMNDGQFSTGLDELLAAWCDGTLDEAACRRLEGHLGASAAARRLYIEYLEHSRPAALGPPRACPTWSRISGPLRWQSGGPLRWQSGPGSTG